MFTTTSTRTRSLVAGLAAIAVVAVAPAAEGAVPSTLAASPELTLAQPTVEPTVDPGIGTPPPPVTPVAPVAPVKRTVGPGVHTPPRPVVTDTATALEVDGVPGGYSRQKCERLAGQWEELTDKAMDNEAQAGGSGPQLEAAANYLEQAEEVYGDMSDNCMIVDPQ